MHGMNIDTRSKSRLQYTYDDEPTMESCFKAKTNFFGYKVTTEFILRKSVDEMVKMHLEDVVPLTPMQESKPDQIFEEVIQNTIKLFHSQLAAHQFGKPEPDPSSMTVPSARPTASAAKSTMPNVFTFSSEAMDYISTWVSPDQGAQRPKPSKTSPSSFSKSSTQKSKEPYSTHFLSLAAAMNIVIKDSPAAWVKLHPSEEEEHAFVHSIVIKSVGHLLGYSPDQVGTAIAKGSVQPSLFVVDCSTLLIKKSSYFFKNCIVKFTCCIQTIVLMKKK